MKKNNILFKASLVVVTLLITLGTLFSQQSESPLFKAMKDEIERSKNELILPNSPAPYFIAYTVGETSYITITASKGVILTTKENPIERINSVNLYVGDTNFSSDYSYSGNGMLASTLLNVDNDYNQIRRGFWQTSDVAYKFAVEVYKSKTNNIKNANLSDEEKALPDMLPLAKVEKRTTAPAKFNLDKELYEGLAKRVSLELSKHKSLYDTRVELDGITTNYYYLTTEGTQIIEPVSYVALTYSGKVRNDKGQVITDSEVIYSSEFDKLPSEQEINTMIDKYAQRMLALQESQEIEEYYLGPVLFIEEASASLFANNLVSLSGVFAHRTPIQVMASVARVESIASRRDVKPLEERIGKKVIDSRITIRNKTDINTFGSEKLIGSYTMDAQGVVPEKESTLIENGILKKVLSTRVPTKKSSYSTGSLRFGVRPRAIINEAAPGILEITTTGGSSVAGLKKELIKAAMEEGLDYAYIVRKISNNSTQYIYKVSVKDGTESLVTGVDLSPVALAKLKRVLGVGNEQMVYNYLYQNSIPVSIIYPNGVLIEDIEINKKPLATLKNSPLITAGL